ncbi:hypothetical protein DITRI_Ditri18aG0054700 [Diplodiscus trichospermus]
MSLILSPYSLQLSTFPSPFTRNSSQKPTLSQPCHLSNRPTTRISCPSTRPRKKTTSAKSKEAEARELVRFIMRSFSDKEPLVKTLNRYVKVVRCEHCFLLFEELAKLINGFSVLRWMQKQRWYIADNGVYSKLIAVIGKKGQIRMAMWLFSEMRNSGCRPDASVYNALITAHLHSRDKVKALDKAVGYFNKMKRKERCKPNIVTYNILLRAIDQARNVDQVNALFKDLTESIIAPDIYTFNGVMDAYGKNGMIREMESVLSQMKSNQCKPDIITFNVLIDSYGKKQEFDKMEQVFKSLLRSKEKPTLPTFNSMIINYGKAQLKERAENVFKKMIDLKYTPSFITYESLIMMYGFCDCVSGAREIFDGIVDSGKEAYTKANMKDLLQKLVKQKETDGIVPNKRFLLEALEAFGSLPASPDSVSTTTGGKPENTAKAEVEVIS